MSIWKHKKEVKSSKRESILIYIHDDNIGISKYMGNKYLGMLILVGQMVVENNSCKYKEIYLGASYIELIRHFVGKFSGNSQIMFVFGLSLKIIIEKHGKLYLKD